MSTETSFGGPLVMGHAKGKARTVVDLSDAHL
jgi:hypothetical protein